MIGNQNARQGPGAGKSDSTRQSQPQTPETGNKDFEDRRNAAACFRNQHKSEDWHPSYVGVMVTEHLPAGTKCWVNVHVRTSRKGEKYVSVVLKRQRER
jgi:hypothetical protein